MAEGRSERATGTPNEIYDLSSVLFHALEGGASYDQYIQDAEEAGDQELADFFRRVRNEDSNRADEAQRLIAERTSTTGEMEDTATLTEGMAGVTSTTEPSTSREGDVPPRRTEEMPPPRPGSSGDLPGTEPIAEEVPPSGTEEPPPPPRTAGIEEGAPTAEEVPSGTPPQAPPGDVQREAGREESEEDKGLVDKAKDYLLGEGRERDYLRGEDRERQDRER
jgi:hypothetical protein